MKKLAQIQKEVRSKAIPAHMSPMEWANAINWTLEAWKCKLSGQNWIHPFTICCPEQYALLTDEKGCFILENTKDIRFVSNEANRLWINRLEDQITEMKANGEWLEALTWSKLLDHLRSSFPVSFPPKSINPAKLVVKGHRLIRIKTAA